MLDILKHIFPSGEVYFFLIGNVFKFVSIIIQVNFKLIICFEVYFNEGLFITKV